jgi:uncharacterized protein (TIGR02466 family)
MNEIKSEIIMLFPTPLQASQYDDLTQSEIDFVKQEKLYSSKQRLPNRTVGTDLFNILDYPEMQRIKLFIQGQLDEFATKIISIDNKLFPTLSWANRSPKGADHYRHRHVNSIVSGVFYLTDNPTPIEFYSDMSIVNQPLRFKPNQFNPFNTHINMIEVKKGTLVLFPSYLEHGVGRNVQDHERLSLSFNTWIDGSIGNLEESSYLNLDDPTFKNENKSNLNIMNPNRKGFEGPPA